MTLIPRAVSIIIPTFRRFEPMLRTLEDVLQQDYPDFEVIVADQNRAWPAECQERLETIRRDPRVRWLLLEKPGVVAARNVAVAESRGEILLFIDDDVFIPSKGLIEAHVKHFDDMAIAAVVGRERQLGDPAPAEATREDVPESDPLPPPPGRSRLQQTLWFDRNAATRQYVCTFCTCNGSIRRSAFLDVGGFDENFAGNSYGDDYDLALRLHRPDGGILYDPAAWLVHRRAPIGGLRLTDTANAADELATIQGFWLFVLRHGHRGMYGHLVFNHVLRKTVLLKRNLMRPWREPLIALRTARGLWRAWRALDRGPRSRFMNVPSPPAQADADAILPHVHGHR